MLPEEFNQKSHFLKIIIFKIRVIKKSVIRLSSSSKGEFLSAAISAMIHKPSTYIGIDATHTKGTEAREIDWEDLGGVRKNQNIQS